MCQGGGGGIACFNSVLDHMCGAQVPVGKREHVGNCTVTPAVSQFHCLSSTQCSFQEVLARTL